MTWMPPSNKKWHMIDYTLVNRKFRSSVEDVRVYRTAAGVIGTDHHLVRTKIKFHLKTRAKTTQKQFTGRLNKMKLHDPVYIQAFQAVFSSTTTSTSPTITTNDKYAELSTTLKNISENFFGDTELPRKHKEWLTNAILDIVSEKSQAFLSWQNHRGTRNEKMYRTQYRTLRKLAKKKVRERQVEYWDALNLEIEQAIKQHDPVTAYRMIRRLKRGKAKIEEMPIYDKQVDLATIQQIPIRQLSSNEQSRQDKPSSLKEVEEAIRRMKSGKAPGMDGISADIIKAGGHALAIQLHALFVEI
ncbi:unnamed protein product [Rotaria sp. Silwood2]|nr:unnamed protein product [Rotaria sp. Silwood2]